MDAADPERPRQSLMAARQMMEIARQGERDFNSGGERRLSGLFNAVTSGRSVTFALQGLRGKIAGFDDWYVDVQEHLRADPVAKWFVTLRNRIEKQGTTGELVTSLHISNLDIAEMMKHAPPGATSMFIGDRLGRSGWEVTLPDGTIQTVFFKLPPSVATTPFAVHDAPDGRSIEDLLPQWLDTVEHVLADAERRFG